MTHTKSVENFSSSRLEQTPSKERKWELFIVEKMKLGRLFLKNPSFSFVGQLPGKNKSLFYSCEFLLSLQGIRVFPFDLLTIFNWGFLHFCKVKSHPNYKQALIIKQGKSFQKLVKGGIYCKMNNYIKKHKYASKFRKLCSGHRNEKGQFQFQFQRKAMPKNAQTYTLVSNAQNSPSQASAIHELWTSRCSSWF